MGFFVCSYKVKYDYGANFAYGMQVWWFDYFSKLLVHKNASKDLSVILELNGITALQSVTRHS